MSYVRYSDLSHISRVEVDYRFIIAQSVILRIIFLFPYRSVLNLGSYYSLEDQRTSLILILIVIQDDINSSILYAKDSNKYFIVISIISKVSIIKR